MLKDQLTQLINQARKERNETRLLVLQSIKDALLKAEISDRKNYNEATESKVLLKLVASHKDSISQFASRPDLVEKEQAELDIINEFAPKEISPKEIQDYTLELINKLKATQGSISMKDMKSILSEVRLKYPTAEGKMVSVILKSYL